jgi:purine-nucleoside/S-methyl-5'-thioadenosine phosphorylase / adenosine deaminase
VSAMPAAARPQPAALRTAAFADVPSLAHGFFGRHGGVSTGQWTSLNVSERVGDDPQCVAANWARVRSCVPGLSVVRIRQVHGVRIANATAADQSLGEADGVVTRTAGLGLAILTADCVPILCVAPDAGAVMALHAGWRGTLDGIAAVALTAAYDWFGIQPHQWRVALGPSIGGCCYEVESHIGAGLIDRWGAMPDAWRPAGSHGQLDLRAANRQILSMKGVPSTSITMIGPCTACHDGDYFSHRRSQGRAGRQVSVIGWAAERPIS